MSSSPTTPEAATPHEQTNHRATSRTSEPSRLASRAAVPVLALVAGLALKIAHAVLKAADAPSLPQWDMGKYGAAGARIADAVRELAPLELLRAVTSFDLWGPVFPLLEAPVFLFSGSSYRSATVLMAVLLGASVLAAFWAGVELDRERGTLVGGIAAAAVATSPLLQLHGAIVMLEVPAALALLVAVALHARSLRTGRRRDVVAAAVAAVLLFFTKFNYGLVWLATLAISEALLAAGSLAGLRAHLAAALRSPRLRRPLPIALLATLALLLIGSLVAGRRPDTIGETRRALSLATPLYAMYMLVLLGAAARPRRSLAALRDLLRALPGRARLAIAVIAPPIALWMLSPSHARGFIHSLENRSGGAGSLLDALAFYPRALASELAAAPLLGAALLVIALAALLVLPRLDPPRRALAVVTALGLVAALAHPHKQARFVAPLAPLVWLSAGALLAHLLGRLAPRRAWLAPALGGLALAAAIALPVDAARLHEGRRTASVDIAVAPLLDALADTLAASGRSVVVGAWNELSPGLLEWHTRQRHAGLPAERMPRLAARVLRGRAPERLPLISGESGVGTILVLELPPGAPAWQPGWDRETAWLDPARHAMIGSPLYRLESDRRFPDSGYRLLVYRRR